MFRSTPLAVIAAAPFVFGQSAPSDRSYPIEPEIRRAGVYDLRTGRWQSEALAKAAGACLPQNVYNNTCAWTGGSYYVGSLPCEDDYDEGRIPLTADGGAGYPGPNNAISLVEFAYCTYTLSGLVDIDFALFDTDQLGGVCVGFNPPTPGASPVVQFLSASSGFPLPGTNAVGTYACWIVGLAPVSPFCLQTGTTAGDLFNFRLRNNNAPSPFGSDGWVLRGEPTAGAGSGTYASTAPCGHGLGTSDSFWANYDNTPVGASSSPCGSFAGFAGTNCYWFGGYPTNPFASFWFRLESSGDCGVCDGDVALYCTSKTNSLGCVPQVSFAGKPQKEIAPCTTAGAFTLTATNVLNNKNGLWFYGKNGVQGAPFQGGHLCVKAPITRLKLRNTGGNPPPNDCTGSVSEDFNDKINGKNGYVIDPALQIGVAVAAQFWSRDPASPSTTSLSQGVLFTICP